MLPEIQILKKLDRLVLREFTQHRRIQYYSAEMGLTVGYLNQFCEAYYGMSLFEYLQAKLLEASQQLLTGSLMSVKCITYELGFQDPAYFTRWFKKKTGMLPKVYRRLNSDLCGVHSLEHR